MRILMLCWRDSTHPQGGGSERYLERVGEHLATLGHHVIYRSSRYTDAPQRSVRDGVHYQRSGGKYGVYISAWLALAASRLGFGPLRNIDVVIDTQNGIPFFARTIAAAPTVLLTHHCHREQWPVAGPFISRLGWWLESTVAPFIYRGARYITVSPSSRDDLVQLGVNPQHIEIIANGVDPVPETTETCADDGRVHLVTLSRLVPHKQIEHALDALLELPDHVVIDVIGNGWWAERLHDYAARVGVQDRVTFHGHVSDTHKHALLARAELHLMPSCKEGWGLAVIEAAQHAVPTIGYREAGGLKDSIKDGVTGVLIDARAQLAPTVAELLSDPERRRRLGSSAREFAAGFEWSQTGERFERLLKGVVDKRRR